MEINKYERNNANKVVCKKCILHTKVPGITLDEQGYCSYCVGDNDRPVKGSSQEASREQEDLKGKMQNLFELVKKEGHTYDVLVMFSGGKDSAYLLELVKKRYNLRPLAFSIIHPMVNDVSIKNMEDVASSLKVDLIKYFPDLEMYKTFMKYGLENGDKYGMTEFIGCSLCSYIINCPPLKTAMMMDIPIILSGETKSQGIFSFVDGEAKKGFLLENNKKPFGKTHDIFDDSCGQEYKGSMYDISFADINRCRYPTTINPLSIIDYDFRNNTYEDKGLSDRNFKSLFTNCNAVHLFDYLSIKRYDCISYIKQFAQGIGTNEHILMQMDVNQSIDNKKAAQMKRDTIIKLMDEYKNILLYIVENKVTEKNITSSNRIKIHEMTGNLCRFFNEETVDVIISKVLKINDLADYFGLDLDVV